MGADARRAILVPPDIVAVRRVSPIKVRKRTPWRRGAEGERVERAGKREWLSDRLFVESRNRRTGLVCGTSMTTHTGCLLGLMVVFVMRPDQAPIVRVGSQLVMPAMTSTMPALEVASSAPRSRERPAPVPQPPPAAAPEAASEEAAGPLEAPSGIEPESTVASHSGGSEGGVEGGSSSGAAGGAIGGPPTAGGLPRGPFRLAPGIEPPRKIKDVRPVYPQGALSDRARGTVILEATVGVDGTVHDVKVIHSVPLLDQAAVDAVRQWEFVPSRMNGVPVAVIITVRVGFAVH